MSSIRNYESGDIIFSEESSGDGVYIVTAGLVSIYRESGGKRIELALIGKGGMFGEMAVIDLKKRSASAKAIKPTEIVHIPLEQYMNALQELPMWSLLLIQMLARRLRNTNEQLFSENTGNKDSLSSPQQESSKNVVEIACADDTSLVKQADIVAKRLMKDFGNN